MMRNVTMKIANKVKDFVMMRIDMIKILIIASRIFTMNIVITVPMNVLMRVLIPNEEAKD